MALLLNYGYAQDYLFGALAGMPDLLDDLLVGLTDARADRRPDSERFTIREVVAHLAEWETVFLQRLGRMAAEERPVLEGYDEWQWAIDHQYARTSVLEQRLLFRRRREQTTAFLRARGPDDWARVGDRPEIGLLTIEGQALLIPLHDAYHLRQIAAFRSD